MLTEFDIQLLEAYLDDGLSTSEVHRLDSRLSDEPALMAALDTLRRERATRVAIFQSLAPTQAEADGLADSIITTVHRRKRSKIATRSFRIAAGIAAGLAVGFAVGWVGRGGGTLPGPSLSPAITAVAPINVRSDVHRVSHAPKLAEPGQYQVTLLDEDGNVIAVQRFGKAEEARQFADDLGQYELRQRQVQENQAMLVSDRF